MATQTRSAARGFSQLGLAKDDAGGLPAADTRPPLLPGTNTRPLSRQGQWLDNLTENRNFAAYNRFRVVQYVVRGLGIGLKTFFSPLLSKIIFFLLHAIRHNVLITHPFWLYFCPFRIYLILPFKLQFTLCLFNFFNFFLFPPSYFPPQVVGIQRAP